MSSRLLSIVVTSALCALANSHARGSDEAVPDMAHVVQVELTDSDLDEIKTVMNQNAAVLASSPGIKHVSAQRSGDAITATVLFFPHEQSGGISHAVNANCHKTGPAAPWTCPSGSLRSYLHIPGQEFEVRVFGSIDYDAALALIDATGAAIHAHPDPGVATLDTVVMIMPMEESMSVGWGDSKGFVRVHCEAVPIEGGKARQASGWRVTRLNDEPWEPQNPQG